VLRRLVALMLTSGRFSSDHLLLTADMLLEAAFETAFEGDSARLRVQSLRHLAGTLQQAAPLFAQASA
jgi:hypothetical protein